MHSTATVKPAAPTPATAEATATWRRVHSTTG